MSKKIQLTIPKPCHENWDNMTPVQQGKFCGSCQKQVVDFSNMSDRQVAEFFKKPSTGSVCGRFMTDQLDRSIEIPKKRIPWVKYFFQFVIPAFLISIKASAQKTQGKIKVATVTKDTTRPVIRPTMGLVAPVCTKPQIKGDIMVTELSGNIQLKVVDEKGSPISYASIETGVIGKGGAADKNGLFNLDKSILNSNGKIFVFYAGYERKEVPVKTFSGITGTYTIVLQTKGGMDEVVVTAICQTRNTMVTGGVTRIDASQLTGNEIKGKVIDEKGNPVFFASVVIKGTTNGVSTKEDGSFSLKPAAGSDHIILVGSYVGYELVELVIDKKTASNSVIIQLKPIITTRVGELMVGELVVCRKPPTKKELKKTPLIPVIIDDKSTVAFKVYPNPVETGTSLNIELKKAEEGYYDLQLFNLSGQIAYQQDIWIDLEARVLNIDIPSVAAGSYFLTLTNKNSGKKFSEKVIIQ
jgi:hypothetical protein